MAEKEYIERKVAKKILTDDYAYNAAKLLDTVYCGNCGQALDWSDDK